MMFGKVAANKAKFSDQEIDEERNVPRNDNRYQKNLGGEEAHPGDTADTHHDLLEGTLSDPNVDPRSIGRILIESGKLSDNDAERIAEIQRREGIFFGEAARKLKLINETDIQYALAQQFNYPYLKISEGIFDEELVAAYRPFSGQAESLRAIRSQLIVSWLRDGHKSLAIVSPDEKEGRSYLAANLAVLFAQLKKRTLLVDADLRRPKQSKMFKFSSRVGLSAMLAGRVRRQDLEHLPEAVPFFTHLSVLGAGATPPNPLELLAGERLPKILDELSVFFDVILIDTPAAKNQADYQPIAVAAKNAAIVVRKSKTRLAEVKKVIGVLQSANVKIVGSIINDY